MPRGSSVSVSVFVSRIRAYGLVCGILACTVLLASCTGPSEQKPPAPVDTSVAAEPTASPEPSAAPTLDPDGTAADNLPLFTAVTRRVHASDDRGHGRAYIDALVDAGFVKERMQVTSDLTTVGRAAESIQFSVAWGDEECLIGQVGPSTGDPVTEVMPQLAEGRCLVGETRAIDW
ncbi:DUF6993 domain-containing protein [Microbacterium suwonense]|uniref:DUF6993 domain-containing protein n=1 Tax=Microbacterium suwonense TaxID=683047 RepID=UPI0025742955|nr:hypothetical protein [Microbacterium suwonense]